MRRATIPPYLQWDSRLEASFDRALYGTGVAAPPLLYHYTSWEAAEQILRSQRFWATAHDCTNDQQELVYADEAILEAARALERRSDGLARRLLRVFSKTYAHKRIGASRRTYLVCFSLHRDDPNQWKEYGRDGSGVCLGLRLFKIPHPNIPQLATGFMPIAYGEVGLREKLEDWFDQFVQSMNRINPPDREPTWRTALDALNVAAAAWALATKAVRWEGEHEVRMVFLVREGQPIVPRSRIRPDSSVHRYIEVPVTRLPRMPVEEFIVGTNQDIVTGRQRAVQPLTETRYRSPERRVAVSLAPVAECCLAYA